jgi:hypothetical protein
MTIDTNTALTVALALTTIYFAISYIRTKLDARSQRVQKQIDSVQEELWRMGERIASLERCCAKQERCEKSYYNTGA